jgi:putative oxidoreductase
MTASSKLRVPARLLLGLIFVTFGLNGFLHFVPQPPVPVPAAAFAGALGATGYMFPLIKVTEIATGLLLLSGRFVPLALVVLAPVVVNIVAFHLFLAPAGLALPFVVLTLGLYLAWTERQAFAPLFLARGVAVSVARPRAAAHVGSMA